MPQPKVVLPKYDPLTMFTKVTPPEGLTEVAQSVCSTLVNVAQALPAGGPGLPGQGGGQAKLGLPKLKQFALSIEEAGPAFMPKMSQVAEQIEKTVGGGEEVKRGAAGAEAPVVSAGGPKRGTL